ncbi:MAG: aldo/keto reductase [Enterobacteriaceae bacterium]
MKKLYVGKTDIYIPKIIFGGNVLGWTVNEKNAFKILDIFYRNGFNCIDTADIYPYWINRKGGLSEKIVGNWIKKKKIKRDSVIIVTKVGKTLPDTKIVNLSYKYIMQSIDMSLKRLKTDYVDIYLSHAEDKNTNLEETLYTFDKLKNLGKIRVIGASNYTYKSLLKSFKVSKENNFVRYELIQPEFNFLYRKYFDNYLKKIVKKFKISVISYRSLGEGFFSGKYRNVCDANKSVRGKNIIKNYLNERGLKILDVLDEISKKYNSTLSQITISWLIKYKYITSPIVSVTSKKQAIDIINSEKINLDKKDHKVIDNISKYLNIT